MLKLFLSHSSCLPVSKSKAPVNVCSIENRKNTPPWMFYEILFELSNVLKLQSYSFCPTSLYLPTPSKFHSYWLAVYSVCTAAIVPYEWAWPRSSGQQPTQRLDVCSSMIAANSFYATHCEVQSPNAPQSQTSDWGRSGRSADQTSPFPIRTLRFVAFSCAAVGSGSVAQLPTPPRNTARGTRVFAPAPHMLKRCGAVWSLS